MGSRSWSGTIALTLLRGLCSEQADSQVNGVPPRSTTEDSRRALEDFARLLDVERNVGQAMGRYFDARLIQHDAEIGDSGHGDDTFLAQRQKLHPEQYLSPEQFHTVVDNLMADGDLVVAKSHVYTNPKDRGRVFVDIWRVAGGTFVEHWDVVQPVPNTSQNKATMWCGGASNWAAAGTVGDRVARPGCGRSGPGVNRDLGACHGEGLPHHARRTGPGCRGPSRHSSLVISSSTVRRLLPGKAAFAKYLSHRTGLA